MDENAQPQSARPQPPPALLAEVNRDLAELARVRVRRMIGFAVVALGLMIGFTAAWNYDAEAGRFADALSGIGTGEALHTALMVLLSVGGFALCALAFGLHLPAGRRLRTVPVIAVAGVLSVMFAISSAFGVDAGDPYGSACMTHGFVVAAVMIGAALVFGRNILRRHAPSAALYGVGAGMLALVPLGMTCPVGTADHLMIWHGLLPALTGALSWGLSRLLQPA